MNTLEKSAVRLIVHDVTLFLHATRCYPSSRHDRPLMNALIAVLERFEEWEKEE